MTTKLILVYILVAVVLTVGLGGYTIKANLNRIREESIRGLSRNADQIMEQVDPMLKSMDQMAVDIFSSRLYKNNYLTFLQSNYSFSRECLAKLLNQLYHDRLEIRRVVIYSLDGHYCGTGTIQIPEEAAARRAADLVEQYGDTLDYSNSKIFLSPQPDFWTSSETKTEVITEIRPIRHPLSDELLGFLEVQQNAMYIDEICQVELYGYNLDLMIVMEEPRTLFYTKNIGEHSAALPEEMARYTHPNQKVFETREAILAQSRSNNFYCYTVVGLEQADLWDYQFSVISGSMLIVLIMGVLSVGFGILLTRFMMRPFDQFVQKLQGVDLDNLDQKLDVKAKTQEVSVLVDAFNQLSYRLRVSLLRQKQHEDYQTRALFQALQKEMGPHFLYNSLGSIADLCECGEGEKAAQACFDLTDLLRYASNYEMPDVTLEEDLENAKCFMSLMQNRYRQRLTFELIVDELALPAMMPRMTLQPLLENAIKYSIQERDVVHVQLSILYVSGLLMVMVRDNGLTITEDRKQFIEQKVEAYCKSPGVKPEEPAVRFGGIGLIGTLTRLRIYFGQAFQYEIHGNNDGGTTLVLYMDRV